jgi:predicted DNA-binding protein (UPF0251 family)
MKDTETQTIFFFDEKGDFMSASVMARLFEPIQTCSLCAANVSKGDIRLCPACEKYVGQDHVAQRELQFHDHALHAIVLQPDAPRKQSIEPSEEAHSFEMLLRRSRLSGREKDVIRLRFVESLNFFSISKRLGISMNSVFSYYRRGLKKVKSCHENFRLVRGQDSEAAQMLKKGSSQSAQVSTKEPKLSPVRVLRPDASGFLQLTKLIASNDLVVQPQMQSRWDTSEAHYPKICPRCDGGLLRPKRQAPYCADCLWVPKLYE